MIILKDDLDDFYKFEDYIKQKSPTVEAVFCNSIYFKDLSTYQTSGWYFTWGDCHKNPDIVLQQINALCGTDFQFDGDES